MQQYYTRNEKGMKTVYNTLIERIQDGEEVTRKLKIIELADKTDVNFAASHYDVGRSTIFLWKKKLKEEGLRGLRNDSTEPINKRRKKWNDKIIKFIKDYRIKHPGVSKEVIYPELKKYCRRIKIKCISQSTIGRIIKHLKEIGQIDNRKKLVINGKTGNLIERKAKKQRRKNRLKKKKITNIGEVIQVDTIHSRLANNEKIYILTAQDRASRIAYAQAFPKLNSQIATEFIQQVIKNSPFKIQTVQTDNGLEFEKHFDDFMRRNKITHFFNYPHSPKSNAQIERFNRTIQEQFFDYLEDVLSLKEINKKLEKYLFWYNTEKVHKGLNFITPMDFYKKNMLKYGSYIN